jgi:CRP-like cAMP-binding protein
MLVTASTRMRHKRKSEIFAIGDEADGLRIVLNGVVRIWISDADGQELTVALLEKGDSFGEIALFDELPRTASATATEDTECLYVPRSFVDTLLSQSPVFAKQVIQILGETIRRNTNEMGAVMFLSLEKRLAQKLCDLAFDHADIDQNTARFSRKFSQGDLSKMLGVTREAINKRLTILTQEGLIEVNGGYMTILNLERLSGKKGIN